MPWCDPRLAAAQKGFEEFLVARRVLGKVLGRQQRGRPVAKTMAADFVAGRGQRRQIARVVKHRAFDRAAAEAARRIISGPRPIILEHPATDLPGRFGKIVKGDAGDRPPPGQADRPDLDHAADETVEAQKAHPGNLEAKA